MKQKLSIFKNNMFILKLIHKASPGRLPFYFISIIFGVATNFLFDVYLLRLVINSIQTGRPFSEILYFIITVGIILVVYYIINNYYGEVFAPVSDKIIYRSIQKQVFAKASRVDLACYETPEFYDTYIKAVNETNQIAQTVMNSVGNMISNILTILSVSLFIFTIDPIFILFTIIPVLYSLIFGKKLNLLRWNRQMEMAEKTRKRDYIKRVFYLVDYAKEMRLTNISKVLFERFYNVINELKQTIKKHGLLLSILDYWSIVIQYVILFIGTIIYTTFRTVVKKNMLYGDCVVIINNIVDTASAMQGIVGGYMQFHSNALSIQNIRAFLEYKPTIDENPDGKTIALNNNELSLNHVSFHYTEDGEDVLRDITMTVKPNEKIALVGHNGAGKTTLVKLLMRLYDPTAGEITLNQEPIKKYNLTSYRSLFATVFQQYKVFSLSVMQNILLKNSITEDDKKQADEAMKNSGIYEKVMSLPNTTETILTREFDPQGAVLSGGEYQKIAIARVFAKLCQIVILDEPSSALDPIAEYKMYEAMMQACENKAMIYISHRLSSAVLADTVYMLENGKIIEHGSHVELLAKNGKYADMWNKQAQQYQQGVKTYA